MGAITREDSGGMARWAAPALLALLLATLVFHALHRRFLMDDAYISFRYARNLAEGQGPVYNPGERVEGYSNLLWVLLIAAGFRAGIEPEALSLVLGIAAGMLALILAWRLARRLLEGAPGAEWWALLPLAWLVSNRSFGAWATSGLETRAYTCLLLWGLLLLTQEAAEGERAAPFSIVPFAALILMRPEGILHAGIALAVLVLLRGGRPGRHGLVLAATLAGVVVAHTAFRMGYYGDWLPNTFYVKVGGPAPGPGFRYLVTAATLYGLWLFLPAAGLGLRRPDRRAPFPWIAAAIVMVHLAYVFYLGGDHFEFRFLDPIWPLVAILAALAIVRVRELVARRVPGIIAASVLAAVLSIWNAVPLVAGFRDNSETFSVETEAGLCRQWAKVGEWFRENAAPDEVIAVTTAGVIPFRSGLKTLDMHGLNDRIIARSPAVPGATIASHAKFATWEDLLFRARTTYLVGHPEIFAGPPADAPAPDIVRLEGRAFAMIPVVVDLGGIWFRFRVISEEAVVGNTVDPTRVRARIRPR